MIEIMLIKAKSVILIAVMTRMVQIILIITVLLIMINGNNNYSEKIIITIILSKNISINSSICNINLNDK